MIINKVIAFFIFLFYIFYFLQQFYSRVSEYGVRIFYYIKEYELKKDSSNMDMGDWVDIGMDVKKNYDKYDSFIILHGTDTMAYTASALSFMFENIDKSVVLTGSQVDGQL